MGHHHYTNGVHVSADLRMNWPWRPIWFSAPRGNYPLFDEFGLLPRRCWSQNSHGAGKIHGIPRHGRKSRILVAEDPTFHGVYSHKYPLTAIDIYIYIVILRYPLIHLLHGFISIDIAISLKSPHHSRCTCSSHPIIWWQLWPILIWLVVYLPLWKILASWGYYSQ